MGRNPFNKEAVERLVNPKTANSSYKNWKSYNEAMNQLYKYVSQIHVKTGAYITVLVTRPQGIFEKENGKTEGFKKKIYAMYFGNPFDLISDFLNNAHNDDCVQMCPGIIEHYADVFGGAMQDIPDYSKSNPRVERYWASKRIKAVVNEMMEREGEKAFAPSRRPVEKKNKREAYALEYMTQDIIWEPKTESQLRKLRMVKELLRDERLKSKGKERKKTKRRESEDDEEQLSESKENYTPSPEKKKDKNKSKSKYKHEAKKIKVEHTPTQVIPSYQFPSVLSEALLTELSAAPDPIYPLGVHQKKIHIATTKVPEYVEPPVLLRYIPPPQEPIPPPKEPPKVMIDPCYISFLEFMDKPKRLLFVTV